MSVPLLEVIDLEKHYGATQALQRVSFSVETGEMFGLLGPNGAGKTTLLSIVSTLLDATAGEVRIGGKRLRPGDRESRRSIGIVPQELAIYGELTARENLHFFGELYGMGGTRLRGRVEEILRAVGLAERADDRTSSFSGGMKRRLNLGAALVHEPQLLLLDEPTVGVDPQSRNHIFEEVRRLNAVGTTVVYTSHYMEEVESLCTRIGIIDRGRLVACDTLPGLLSQLEGEIRLTVNRVTSDLLSALQEAGVKVVEKSEDSLRLRCREVKTVLFRLPPLFQEQQVEVASIAIEEPSLERVFLHLTGKELRD